MIDLEKEREAFDKDFGVSEFNISASNDENISQSLVLKCNLVGWMRCAESKQQEIEELKARLAQVESAHKGGYYIQDKRCPIGNSLKCWYKSGYGTKHANFFWCETLEEAEKYKGGADWFEIWYAPYIDSLTELTVDVQFLDRHKEKVMIEAAQGDGDE